MKSETYQGFQITTYVINLPERVDRKTHIEKQFFNKPEFLLQFITAETHPIGAVGLWKSIVKIVNHALHNTTDDVISSAKMIIPSRISMTGRSSFIRFFKEQNITHI